MKGAEEIQFPEGWAETRLGDIAEYVNGRAFKPSEWESEGLPIIRIQNLNNPQAAYNYTKKEFEEKYKVENGDLLFAWSASLGAFIWRGETAWLNQHIFKVKPRTFVSKTFLYYNLSHVVGQLYAKTHGSGMVHITKKKFEDTKVILPPLAEQHRIVAKIEELFSELDNGVVQLRQVQAQLKSYRQSVLKHAFEGKLTEVWRQQHDQLPNAQELLTTIQQERHTRHQQALKGWQQSVIQWAEAGKPGGTPLGKKPTKPKASKELLPLMEEEKAKLPDLPQGWEWTEMKATVLEACLGKMLDKKKNKGELMPYLRNINVRWFSFETDDLLEMRFEQSEHDRYSVKKGDLVICEGGEPGRAAIWDGRIANMKIQKALHRVRFFNHLIHNKFILYYLSYSASTGHLANFFTGTTIKHLTGKGLSDLTIPLCSTEEQHQIVQEIESRLSVADHLEKTVEDSLHQAEVLRQSILQRAFSGQLVSQDANDEPATELLKRIQQEKSESSKKSVRTKASNQTDEQLSITF